MHLNASKRLMSFNIRATPLVGAVVTAVVAAACTYDAQMSRPDPAGKPPAGQAANTAGGPTIDGIERFSLTLKPITHVCSGHNYKLAYEQQARERIVAELRTRLAAAADSGTVTVRSVDAHMRCLLAGFGSMQTACVTDATVSLQTSWTDGRRTLGGAGTGTGTGRAPAGVVCENGGLSIGMAVDAALDAAIKSALTPR
jgi:hypothetical protein